MRLTTNEVVALFDLDEGRVRKDVEHGVLGPASPPRFDLAAVVYLRTVAELGFELRAIDDRRRLYQLVLSAMKGTRPVIALSEITEVRLDPIVREVEEKVERFMAWKARLVIDPRILGGEPVFPSSRLAVRHVGGMLLRGATAAEVREDYPYLQDEDLELAALYARAYPRMGRPGDRTTAAR
jgi:uncharacterized protein (DUF433 family)